MFKEHLSLFFSAPAAAVKGCMSEANKSFIPSKLAFEPSYIYGPTENSY